MSREKRFCYILILVFYILFTIIQGIAVVYPVDWITINSIKITEETVEIKFGTAGSASFHAYYKTRITEGNCLEITPYYFISPLFRRGLWSGGFTVTQRLDNIDSIKLVDNNGGEIYIPITDTEI